MTDKNNKIVKKTTKKIAKKSVGGRSEKPAVRRKSGKTASIRAKGKVRLGVRVYGTSRDAAVAETVREKIEGPRPAALSGQSAEAWPPPPEDAPRRAGGFANLADREKRLVMWSGVTFFMILILFAWYLSGDFFNFRPPAEAPRAEASLDLGEAKKELASVLDEMKQGISELRAELEKSTTTEAAALPAPADKETEVIAGENPAEPGGLPPAAEISNDGAADGDKIRASKELPESDKE